LQDACEYLTYEKIEAGVKFINQGDAPDSLYIVMDGVVNFYADLKENDLN